MIGLACLAAVLVVPLVIVALARSAPTLLAVRRDAARALVLVAIHALPAERRDWGAAMLAELDHVRGRRARWRFALGCVRATLTRPPLLTLATVAASLALGALVTFQLASGGLDAASRAWQAAAVVALGAFAGLALILSADDSRRRGWPRRLGVGCGAAVAGCLFLPQLLPSLAPSGGASGGAGVFAGGPAVLAPLLLGAAAGWTGRSGPAVIRTSVWAALAAGIVFVGRLVVASISTIQSLNSRTEDAVIWPVLLLASAGNGFVVGLAAAALGAAARKLAGSVRA